MNGFKSAAVSDVGRVRKVNEDSFYLDPKARFAVLADGMGGHKGGKVASTVCVELMKLHLDADYENYTKATNAERMEKLRHQILTVSIKLHSMAAQDDALSDMGTTLVVWIRMDTNVLIAHAGDSRAYLYRNKDLFQVTNDHSFEQEQVRKGYPLSLAKQSPMRHMLSRNVGLNPPSEPTFAFFAEHPKDIWCLCSDGLSNKVTSQDIAIVINNSAMGLESQCQALVDLANKNGGEDNITVIILQAQPA